MAAQTGVGAEISDWLHLKCKRKENVKEDTQVLNLRNCMDRERMLQEDQAVLFHCGLDRRR